MPSKMSPEAKKNQNAYHREWQKENMKQYNLRLNVRTDADIIARMSEQKNALGYLKSLIRSDIARNPSPAPEAQADQE